MFTDLVNSEHSGPEFKTSFLGRFLAPAWPPSPVSATSRPGLAAAGSDGSARTLQAFRAPAPGWHWDGQWGVRPGWGRHKGTGLGEAP